MGYGRIISGVGGIIRSSKRQRSDDDGAGTKLARKISDGPIVGYQVAATVLSVGVTLCCESTQSGSGSASNGNWPAVDVTIVFLLVGKFAQFVDSGKKSIYITR